MKTSTFNRYTLDQMSREMRECRQPKADAEAWRIDALERSGDLAMAARLQESRAMAVAARERSN